MSQWAVSGSPASPVELNRRIAPQSHPSTAPAARQAFASDGTSPSMETSAAATNSQNPEAEEFSRTRCWDPPGRRTLTGVLWDQTMAFGSPVVPLLNRMMLHGSIVSRSTLTS